MLYSKNKINEIIKECINDYTKFILDMDSFMKTDYAKRINVNVFLGYHKDWAKYALEIINEVYVGIINSNIKQSDLDNLSNLIDSCRKEHEDIEETYRRVDYENTKDYYNFEGCLMRLREKCDEINYWDAFIDTLYTMNKENIDKMCNKIEISGINGTVNIQQGNNNSFQLYKNDNEINYENIKLLLQAINNYSECFNSEFKEHSDNIKNQIKKLEDAVISKTEPQMVKKTLGVLKDLLVGCTSSVIASELLIKFF